MRRCAVVVLSGLLAAACGGDETSPCGPTSGVVARVIDGDTIELESGEKIRYLLVDTPESTTTTECFGPESATYNRELVEGKAVALAYGVECEDRFGRTLAYVTEAGSGREINTLLVERGYACVLFIPPSGADRADEFDLIEDRARAENRGLWGACEDIPCN